MATNSTSKYFTAKEVANLQDGLPSLREWSSNILVPFHGFRLRNPRVVWLNRRWFEERLFDLTDQTTCARIKSWTIEEFAYICPATSDDREHIIEADIRTLFADRYGSSTGLAFHGGSGRAAVTDYFQAKGIGRTHLVSPDAPPDHSHGCMSMAEAVREAIFAEIAAAEFPHGAVPIIAIIDVGFDFSSPDTTNIYEQHARRAIVVRPLAVRFSHMERAPRFKRSIAGFINNQAEDAIRTKDVVDKWMSGAVPCNTPVEEALPLRASLDAVVDQIAFGQVHRLFCGGYFSSNLTIAGELIDFGNMYALPNWSYAQVHSVAEGFGLEMSAIRSLVSSLCFYVSKYKHLKKGAHSEVELYQHLTETYLGSWKGYCLTLFQANSAPEVIKETLFKLLWQYYIQQQKHWARYSYGQVVASSTSAPLGWIYSAVVGGLHCQAQAVEYDFLTEIDKLFMRDLPLFERVIAWQTASRLLKPRSVLDRKRMLVYLDRITKHSSAPDFPDIVGRYITETIDRARRFWPRLPNGYGVSAHVTRGGSSALLLYCNDRRRQFWIEGIIGPHNTLLFFDQHLVDGESHVLEVHRCERYWSAIVEAEEIDGRFFVDTINRNVSIPAVTVTYGPPDQRWIS